MNALARQIAAEVQTSGPISFAEFMQRALYDPVHGYYTRPERAIGRSGDFFTSVSVGPLFGELLAFQFARWMEQLPWVLDSCQCVEAGAHDGRLACDILEALEETEPAIFAKLQYWIIEPSPARRHVQQKTLERFANIRWFDSLREIKGCVWGVFFSNELFDAMPVHVFRWDAPAQHWSELGAGVKGEQLTWMELPWATIARPRLPRELLMVLPDGYRVEMSLAALRYAHEAALTLAGGKMVTIDYGGTLEELLSPSRTSGTLRAYAGHRLIAEVLQNPGEQDITAHANFSELRRAGELAGLKTDVFTTQSQFLTGLAHDCWARRESWPQNRVRQFQTLTHPEHLGRPFRVLVQSR